MDATICDENIGSSACLAELSSSDYDMTVSAALQAETKPALGKS